MAGSVAVVGSEDPEPYLADAAVGQLPTLTRILLPEVGVLGAGDLRFAVRSDGCAS